MPYKKRFSNPKTVPGTPSEDEDASNYVESSRKGIRSTYEVRIFKSCSRNCKARCKNDGIHKKIVVNLWETFRETSLGVIN